MWRLVLFGVATGCTAGAEEDGETSEPTDSGLAVDSGLAEATGTTGDTGATDTADTGTLPADEMAAACGSKAAVELTVKSLNVSLELAFDFDPTWEAFGLFDCTATWAGTASKPEEEGACLTFTGDWARTGSDCTDDLVNDKEPIVWADASGEAYHTLMVDADGETISAWIVHGNRREGVPNDAFEDQFWVTEIDEDGSVGTVDYTETAPIEDGGLQLGTLDTTLSLELP